MKTNQGFWRPEDYLVNIMRIIADRYQRGILNHWSIAEIKINGDKAAVKWLKLSEPLTDFEVMEIYGYYGVRPL